MPEINGIIPVNKPYGMTSRLCVNKISRALKYKKIGHCGTLDPNATGVLPILIGKCTKLSDYLLQSKKEYIAEIQFGIMTPTLDIWSEITEKKDSRVTLSEFNKRAELFVGEITQTPPMYSAVKVNGRKLYELAREGIEVERKERIVHIYEIQTLGFDEEKQRAKIRVVCSSGTYIRTLISDIALSLGTIGVMSSLVRSYASLFSLGECCELDKVISTIESGGCEKYIISAEKVFADCERLDTYGFGEKLLGNGQEILLRKYFDDKSEGIVRLYSGGEFYAAGRIRTEDGEKFLKIENRFI